MGSNSTDSPNTTLHSSPPQRRHVVLFPFMSKGHTIPLLHLSRLLLSRRLADVTIFTTPANRPFIDHFLSSSDVTATVIALPFPPNIHPEIPAGVESTEGLLSVTHRLFDPFAVATKLMQRDFENALASLIPRVSFIISDAFLWWTLDVATKLGLPRLAFYGFNNYAMSVFRNIYDLKNNPEHSTNDESSSLLALPRFPWIEIKKQELDPSMGPTSPEGMEFQMNVLSAVANSFGLVTNSFYELEPVFVDYLNADCASPKSWNVGPLCQLITNPNSSVKLEDVDHVDKPAWLAWLYEKHVEGRRVLYIAFGTQAVMSYEQVKEIAKGLENSNVSFLWVIRKVKKNEGLTLTNWWDLFQEKVRCRGMVVSDWVDQTKILNHKSVEGFLTHCGWNSAMEAICAGVPMLTWPMMAEQPLNAKMVVEEVKVGLRVELTNEWDDGVVKAEGIEKMVRKLMEEEEGDEVRKKAKELAVAAKRAVEEGGSSWQTLQSLVDEACR